jgi:hypothetical protein
MATAKKKIFYGLKTRLTDEDKWSEPIFFKTARERNGVAAVNRIIGGIRTYSFEEMKTLDEIEEKIS